MIMSKLERRAKSAPILAALAAGTAVLALATPSYAQSSDPIKIGVIAEAQAVAGSSIPQAAQLAADEINAKGGINGRKIEIVTYDNHSSAAESVRAFQRGGACARTLDRTFEDGNGDSGRRIRRDHAKHRQGLRQPQIHVPRLSDVDQPRLAGVRCRQGPACERSAHEE